MTAAGIRHEEAMRLAARRVSQRRASPNWRKWRRRFPQPRTEFARAAVCFGFCAGGYRPTLVLPLIFDQVIWHRISGQGSAIGWQHEARHPAATGHLYSAMSLQMGKECGGRCQLRRAAQASLSGALGEHPEGRFLQFGVVCFSSTNPPASSFLK
ncbi:uncharacterized protein BO95DRAFT_77403 [Aspergillus brunneoviolaceus CBS 621.78]|uniref:Uncharacterized protein n=1 Tax=Aspergillus brunneoviolaceus CBS 621.78 TaxID=1450534 RepID=A0ACD1GQC7_9EURO|nr:hypothetical protein BO95DRAFT_77403 [Aspergillus brunneoviolaceus CBS 621.78]RAH51256.1 hypothetical protein BO95DRAFT_77403 [Aspergillus brunneoviolaceus CBS 621.78]